VRLARLAIWFATAGFVFMLFYPLVMEIFVRFGTHADSGVP